MVSAIKANYGIRMLYQSARLSPMDVEIRNPAPEARLQKQVEATGGALS
jgi:hypothetical protein